MRNIACVAVLILVIAPFAFSYSIILKNGKIVEGTLIGEDDEKFSIKDKDGVVLNFKKGIVDLEKTAAANKPPEKAAVVEKEPEKPVEPKPAEKPKKPARVYDSSDLNRLRGEYPMESGEGVDFEEGKPEITKGRSGEEWQAITQGLLAEIKSAEQAFKQLSAKCKEFQGATIQTHVAVTPEGKQTDLVQAKDQVCQDAENAKAALESARQEHASAVEQARQENIPPGYIATE